MNNIFICEICKHECHNMQSLGIHVTRTHKITKEIYYKTYLAKAGEGVCKLCGKPTAFHSLTKGFYIHCCKNCANKDPETEKHREETMLIKFNVRHASENKDIYNKSKITYKEHTGYNCPAQNPIIKLQMQKYRNENEQKFLNERIKSGKTYQETMKNKFIDFIKPYKLELIEWNNKEDISIKCTICNNTMEHIRNGFIYKRIKKNLIPCSYCLPKPIQTSFKKEAFKQFIKENYNGTILENNRLILGNNLEIDIFLPDKNIGFEFDGTYWHADSRFYKEDTYIYGKNMYAKDIWKRDLNKDIIAKKKGIKLIRIKEFDWDNDPLIKEIIKTYF